MDHSLFNLCLQFKAHVCAELRGMPQMSRDTLKGDYLFVIDGIPLFIMLVDGQGAWSVLLKPKENESTSTAEKSASAPLLDPFEIEVDASCPFPISTQQIHDIIGNASRCQIQTDGNTLKRLLLGTLRARVAFITQRVKISGDFPAFLKIISYLKTKGVKPKNSATPTSIPTFDNAN